MSKKAILLGASGLIGHNLLEKLLSNDNYREVLSISRKSINLKHDKLQELIIDFDQLNDNTDQISGDEVFCCLGSTIKKTPDLDLYRKIDYQYPLDFIYQKPILKRQA